MKATKSRAERAARLLFVGESLILLTSGAWLEANRRASTSWMTDSRPVRCAADDRFS